MQKLPIVLFLCVILTSCAVSLEGTQCPYVIRQDRFYNAFEIGENQVLQSKFQSELRVEYNIRKEDSDSGGYYISGKLYADKSRFGDIFVATMDSNWKIIAHVAGSPSSVRSSPTLGGPFSAYINPELYDVSKFRYITFGMAFRPFELVK